MKNIKKFLLTMAMTMALGTSAFAASWFEFSFQLDGGAGAAIPNKEVKIGADAFDIGLQLGFRFGPKA